MTTSRLPARPSLESLRKQAKKLARDIAAGDAARQFLGLLAQGFQRGTSRKL